MRFILIFFAVLLTLFSLEMLETTQALLVQPWTQLLAKVSALLMVLFDSDVISYGRVIQSQSRGFGVSIEAGCNGVEAAIILIAAVLAFPAPARLKLYGIVIGCIAVQLVNVLRIISLYYLGLWNDQAFEFAHLYLWQALIMLDVLAVWLLWVRVVARRAGAEDAR